MKKITTLFILAFIFLAGLFANPKIPKIDNYFKTLKDDYTGTNYLFYVNNLCTNSYKIFAEISDNKYTLYFSNISLVTNLEVCLCMNFPTERDLDNYIYDIDTSDLESEFNSIRQTFIKYNIEPIYSIDEKKSITKIMYIVHQN